MTFIRNHLSEAWACGFFVVVTARFRMLYVFVVLSLGRRHLVHVGVTEHPSATWTAQRLVEATIEADQVPRFLIHDRDSIYGGEVIPPRAPQANSFCERMIGTLRRDCLDHVIIWNVRHAERVLRNYTDYYLGRPHRGLRMQSPDGARHLPPPRRPPGTRILATPIVGGLHHRYGFSAATTASRRAA